MFYKFYKFLSLTPIPTLTLTLTPNRMAPKKAVPNFQLAPKRLRQDVPFRAMEGVLMV